MKRIFFVLLALCLGLTVAFASAAISKNNKVILLISEQNISGPQRAWWASQINLSAVEQKVAQKLIEQGFIVLEPSDLTKTIKRDRAFSLVDISEDKSVKLGRLSKADYIVLGKAVASSGARVPQSSMVSCFANVTAKLIRAKDGKVLAYLDASGNSAHMDVVSGGREALGNAGSDLANRVINALKEEAK
ncbi:MAG: CsgG/HfaB family protein [Candidatus Omnitrophica bacterium]|nr:CsgG/HfaB family protein [Candidatus Omnitrophota bacterium]MBU1869691.1 CsgG/HfaB family protein [Candidatus Omnitrophota bacterium]